MSIDQVFEVAGDSVLHKMCTWFAVNKLSLNVSKTSYMLFGNNNLSANIDITINGVNID